jgi:hypothetical protein
MPRNITFSHLWLLILIKLTRRDRSKALPLLGFACLSRADGQRHLLIQIKSIDLKQNANALKQASASDSGTGTGEKKAHMAWMPR